jgi:glycosyltransferase involved in cell wall biosynthesis
MSDRPCCSVIVVTWNRRTELETALESVYAQTIAGRLEVIVVDNASTDDTVAWLSRDYGRPLRLLRYATNQGASHGRNAGILAARAQRICFLDSDAELLAGDAIERCLGALEGGGDVRAVSGPIWFDRAKTRPFCLGGYFTPEGHFNRKRTHSECENPMFLSTCFSVWDKRLLEELRGFDPWYFWGVEDCDLGLRAHFCLRRGIRTGASRFKVVEGADVLHEMSARGRHYHFDDFAAKFRAVERQRMYLVQAYGGVGEFFRVLVSAPLRLRRIETDAWERRLSPRQRWLALGWYPLRRLLALGLDYRRIHANHLAVTPPPEEISVRVAAGASPPAAQSTQGIET